MPEKTVDEALNILTDRQKKIIQYKFGITDGVPKTLDQVGEFFGVIREG